MVYPASAVSPNGARIRISPRKLAVLTRYCTTAMPLTRNSRTITATFSATLRQSMTMRPLPLLSWRS